MQGKWSSEMKTFELKHSNSYLFGISFWWNFNKTLTNAISDKHWFARVLLKSFSLKPKSSFLKRLFLALICHLCLSLLIILFFSNKSNSFSLIFLLQERLFLTISNYIFTAIFVGEMTLKVKPLLLFYAFLTYLGFLLWHPIQSLLFFSVHLYYSACLSLFLKSSRLLSHQNDSSFISFPCYCPRCILF